MTVADYKRFILRALASWAMPLPQPQLETLCRDAFKPRPLLSDVHDAIVELERDGFISGASDELDRMLTTWSLTDKGRHQAKQL